MTNLLTDLRYALRQLRRAPFFSLSILFTLALAIGATAAMTGVLRATLLNPLPYPHAEQLVQVQDQNLRGFQTNGLISVARVENVATLEHEGHRLFSHLGSFFLEDATLSIPGRDNLARPAAGVSGDFFSTIGVDPALGRSINDADQAENAPQVLVISHRLWTSAFGSDPSVIGQVVRLGGKPAAIVGVMPRQFDLPSGVDLWHASRFSAASFHGYRGDGSRFLVAIARLHPSETLASATQQTTLLAAHLATTFSESDAAWGFRLIALRTSLFGSYRQALLLLSAAVALVLLVASVNIAGLQLSRNAARRQEFAIRSALGVAPARLVTQLLTENLLLVGVGSLIGIAASALLLRALASRLPLALMRIETPRVDLTVLAISWAIALAVGLLVGLLPALQSRHASLASPRLVSRGGRRFGQTFTAVQIALALVLLTLSSTVLTSLYRVLNTRLGFTTAQLSTCSVDLPWTMEPAKLHRLYQQVEESARALPGVSSVGAISALPLSDFSVRRTFDIAGQPTTPRHDAVVAEGRSISPGYLDTMHIALLAGQSLGAPATKPAASADVLVNQTLATRYFAGRNPVGQHLVWSAGLNAALASSQIVGVVADVHGTGGALTAPIQPEVYTAEDGGWPHMQFALRSPLPASALEPAFSRLVSRLDASASVSHFTTVEATLNQAYAQPRLNAALLTAFAGLSLLLVIIGVYGLVAFDLSQRTREFGLRLALGSSRSGLVTLVTLQSGRILGAGLALGLCGSWLAAHLLATGPAGSTPSTPEYLAAAAAILSLALLAATLVPARRATRIDPVEALRSE